MNYALLAPYAFGMFLLAVSPGPGVFGSISKSISGGFASSLYFIGGLVLGDSIFLVLAILGLSAISMVMGELFFYIKIVGGLYLIYLGIKMFHSKGSSIEIKKETVKDNFKTFMGGFLVTMGNPKPILFYASVLPTILDINDIRFFDGAIMVIITVLITYIVIGTYCYLASLGRKVMQQKNLFGKVNKGAGVVMISTGTYLVVK